MRWSIYSVLPRVVLPSIGTSRRRCRRSRPTTTVCSKGLADEPRETRGTRLVGRREDQQPQMRCGLDGVGSVFERDLAEIRIREGVDAFRAARDLGAAPV